MNLFARFTALWTKDQDGQIETLKANLAAANDALDTERERANAAERELRPFQEYVAAADALAAEAAAAAAADRDANAPTESGDGADGDAPQGQ